jgi:hypothetical protein
MQEAGYKTRPVLLVWGGAPRRNRTGDPILTMDRRPSAVLTRVLAGHWRPWTAKLCAQSQTAWQRAKSRRWIPFSS